MKALFIGGTGTISSAVVRRLSRDSSSEFLTACGEKPGYDFEGSLTGDKAVSVVFDKSKLKRLAPDMKTTVPFHKGVRIALAYILDHMECRVEDHDFDKWCDKVIDILEAAKAEF